MMHLEVLVEEPSAEAALYVILERLLRGRATFRIHPHQGKADLLRCLPSKLSGYAKWMTDDYRIVVLVDRDRDDCRRLKRELEQMAEGAAVPMTSTANDLSRARVLNRIAIEELEAWFFGDVGAICEAFPGVSPTLGNRRSFRDPDAIAGGTWERLEEVLQRAGYYKGGLAKIDAARRIARAMVPDRNRSRSFQVFRNGIASLVDTVGGTRR